MLTRLRVKSFKSIVDQEIILPRLTVLFGPNASGKSNFIEAIQCLSNLATVGTIDNAPFDPIRGNPQEYFMFPKGGLSELYKKKKSTFELEADVMPLEHKVNRYIPKMLYRVRVGLQPSSGQIFIDDEYLQHYTVEGRISLHAPKIEKNKRQFIIRRSGKGGPAKFEGSRPQKTILSNRYYSGQLYRSNDILRKEIHEWKTYYLDPRLAMRKSNPFKQVSDIGVLGENLSSFLYRLSIEKKNYFAAVKRKVKLIIPSVNDIEVKLDDSKGEIDLEVIQDGISYSSRVVSEGTLRIIALCAIAVNPWSSSLIAFEEPENGVHPRRLELIAELIKSLALETDRQVIVTTHSPQFCEQIVKYKRENPEDVALKIVKRRGGDTVFEDFDPNPLLADKEIMEALSSKSEDGIIGELLMRGLYG